MNLVAFHLQISEAVREGEHRYSSEIFVLTSSFDSASTLYLDTTDGFHPSVLRLMDAYATTLEDFECQVASSKVRYIVDDRATATVSFAVGDVVRKANDKAGHDKSSSYYAGQTPTYYITSAYGFDGYTVNGEERLYRFEDLVLVHRVTKASYLETRRHIRRALLAKVEK